MTYCYHQYNGMMQMDCPYLVRKIIQNMAILDSEKTVEIKQIQAWHKTLSTFSGCIKLKTNYQLNFVGIVIQ